MRNLLLALVIGTASTADVRAEADIPAVKDRLSTMGIVARGSTSIEFAAAIEEQRAKIATIAAAIGTKSTD